MCGRYTSAKDLSELAKLINFIVLAPFLPPRFNIAPTQQAPVIIQDNHTPTLKMLRWGLIPSWAKDETGPSNINARIETLSEKPSFRSALKKRRCLIPADSFFEWKQNTKPKQPFRIMLKTGDVFCFAGLWEKWIRPPSPDQDADLEEPQIIESFTIITTQANEAIKPLHDRMPVIVAPEMYRWWLNDDPENDAYKMALDRPLNEPLKIYPVSTLVNSAKVDSPECIKPVKIDRDLFEKKWWGED